METLNEDEKKIVSDLIDKGWSEDKILYYMKVYHWTIKDEFDEGTKGWAWGNCRECHHGTWDENGNAIEDK